MRSGIFGYVETRNTNCACVTCDIHCLVEYDCRLFGAAMALRLESDCVDETIDDGFTDDGLDEVAQSIMSIEIDRFEANLLGVRQAVFVHVANHHDRRTKNACGGRRS